MRFQNKVALVVGGNSGIGLSVAQLVSEEGGTAIITGRDPKTLASAEAAVPGLKAFQADVSDVNSIQPVLDYIRETHGRIDCLFVNAGGGTFGSVREITPEIWDQTHNINLKGCFFAIQHSLALMGRGSSIVVTGSIGGAMAIPGNLSYAASKAGLRAVVRILALELVGEGIRVNMVSPGPTETAIMDRSGLDEAGKAAARVQMIAATPMHRIARSEEVAKPMLFLASDDASFVTGIDMFVDGGCVEL